MSNNYAVIMAGGIGSRFWPASTLSRPKQFIDILGTGKTLIQQTYDRLKNVFDAKNIVVVTNESYKDLVTSQLPEINGDQLICEPQRRNTAPCIAYASYKIGAINENATFFIAPADHLILNENRFYDTIETALKVASKEEILLTLGIKPTRPDTGYGYIQFVEKDELTDGVKKVRTFTEKPDIDLAKSFLKSGDFLWNSGMFVWSYRSFVQALENCLSSVNDVFKEGLGKYNTDREKEFVVKAYSMCQSVSIDYGIMEKARNVYVISAEFDWSDLGTWGSLHQHMDTDNNKNAIKGKRVMLYDTKGSIINIEGDKLAVIQGLKDFIVVETKDVLLICHKNDEQKIKHFVNTVKLEIGERFV